MKWPQEWREVRVADVLCRVADKFNPSTAIADHFYVGLEHIESHSGRLLKEEIATDVASLLSAKTRFRAGDVLFGKLRPNLNKVYLASADGICSTDIWALRPREFLLSEYAALYLRSEVFNRAVTQLAVGANLPRVQADAFDRLPFLLPPLPEQQRIVEVLRAANGAASDFAARRGKLAEIVDQQLASTIARCNETDWQPLGRLVTSKYGTSVRADAGENVGAPVLRIPNVIGSEVDLSDLKYVELSKTELDRLRLTEGDVLIVRSNGNPDYVGRCAAVDEATILLQPVFASYLIRLRPERKRLLGSYLAALLNSSVGRNAMRNAIRTTAGQSNLSADALADIRIPVPSPEDQRQFAQVWDATQAIRRQFDVNERAANKLNTALIAEALSGRLTATWREQHAQVLAEAARERDARLGAPAPKVTVHITELATAERRTDLARPRRQALIEQLSRFQHEAWNTLRFEWRGAVLADDPAAFEEFCTSPQTAWRLESFAAGREEVRRALEQLAGMGLIRKMSLPRSNPNSGRTEYLTAFRPLREAEDGSHPEEDTALADAERLARELERRRAPGVR